MQEIDWSSLGFAYMPTRSHIRYHWKDGAWDKGTLVQGDTITMSIAAGCLHYGQEAFEGLKVFRQKDGKVVAFRPEANAERMQRTAVRTVMPPVPTEMFLDALDRVVKDNIDYVPPYGTGCTMYVRPLLIGTGPQIGVAPAPEFIFRVFVMPVGAYFKGAVKPLKICVSDYDRAAPRGTGNVKAGLNYAMSLYPTVLAHQAGFAENLYLDPATRTYVEETGGTNIIFVDADNTVVVPKSPSILPSITRRSLMYVAEHYLGLKVVERQVKLEEVKNFKECALCGTAAVLAPVGEIHTHDGVIALPSGMEKMGEISTKLRQTLTGIQACEIEAPEGWIYEC